MDVENFIFPKQQIPFSRKTKKWRKQHLDWADSRSYFNYELVRNSVTHKKINYDLVAGKLRMKDLELILNPSNIDASFIPDSIQHYPIINSKLTILKGEEIKRPFEYRVVVTNPNAVSEKDVRKMNELTSSIQEWIKSSYPDEDSANTALERVSDYFRYDWQDIREMRANELLKHYSQEYDFKTLFNDGFMDALIVSEEMYQCDIVGGEPTIERLNPLKVRVFKSGYSNRVEDADMIVLEDFWSPGKIIDTYYDQLSKKDIDYIENLPNIHSTQTDSMDNYNEMSGYINLNMVGEEFTSTDNFFWDPLNQAGGVSRSFLHYDTVGNIRVLRIYWKSRRRIKKVKSFD